MINVISAHHFFSTNQNDAVLTVTVAVGIQDKPATAPQDEPWKSDFKWFNKPTFNDALSAVSGFVFAYGGVPAFFSIAAEMKNPVHYTRCLLISQTAMTLTYVVIGSVMYGFCGSYVSSPALGSAGGSLKKVCYGIALPGLIVSTALFIHVSSFGTLEEHNQRKGPNKGEIG